MARERNACSTAWGFGSVRQLYWQTSSATDFATSLRQSSHRHELAPVLHVYLASKRQCRQNEETAVERIPGLLARKLWQSGDAADSYG